MKTLLKRLVGWCLAMLGWAASLVFRLVDYLMYQEIAPKKSFYDYTPEKPFPGLTPDRYDQEAANRIADEFLVLDLLYEVCDDWEANHG